MPAEQRPFAEFVKEAPILSDASGRRTLTLTGVVLRAENEGSFLLAMGNGQMIELGTDAVENYTVVQETPQQRVVQLQVSAERLSTAPTTARQSPFIMATPHQASQAALQLQGISAKTVISDTGIGTTFAADTVLTRKEVIKDVVSDPIYKEVATDPLIDHIQGKGTRTDALTDPIKNLVFDPPNSWIEQTYDPGEIYTNPGVYNLPGMF